MTFSMDKDSSEIGKKQGYGEKMRGRVVAAYDKTHKAKDKKRSEEDATRLHQDIFDEENGELVSPNSASSNDDEY